MDEHMIFAMALGLPGTPWRVEAVELDALQQQLTIRLGFAPGSRFAHPQTGQPAGVYDTSERRWRHLNFFQYACEIVAPLPRVGGGTGGARVLTVSVPWARDRSGFTLMMEALMVVLIKGGLTVQETARLLDEWPKRIWRTIVPLVNAAIQRLDLSPTTALCLDETHTRKGQRYLTVASDPRAVRRPAAAEGRPRYRARVVAVADGRDSASVGQIRHFLEAHGCPAGQIATVIKDMSAAFAKGVKEHFPTAETVVDYFHVMRHLMEAFDQVRAREHRRHPELFKDSLWAWRTAEGNLDDEQAAVRSRLLRVRHLQTGRACVIVEAFREIMREPNVTALEKQLQVWYRWARRSRIPEIKKAVLTIEAHWQELLAYARTRLSNAVAEALNGLIQTARRKSRGFDVPEHFRAIIFLLGANLTFDLPEPLPSRSLNP
jgi:transposase